MIKLEKKKKKHGEYYDDKTDVKILIIFCKYTILNINVFK